MAVKFIFFLQDKYVERLKEYVEIQSISVDDTKQKETKDMVLKCAQVRCKGGFPLSEMIGEFAAKILYSRN